MSLEVTLCPGNCEVGICLDNLQYLTSESYFTPSESWSGLLGVGFSQAFIILRPWFLKTLGP